MGLTAHTVSRRGREFEVSAGGQLVEIWTDASAPAQAAAVAGIADGVAVPATVGGAASRRLGEAPKRDLGDREKRARMRAAVR